MAFSDYVHVFTQRFAFTRPRLWLRGRAVCGLSDPVVLIKQSQLEDIRHILDCMEVKFSP
jgi:hypothetical protein